MAGALQVNENTSSLAPAFEEAMSRSRKISELSQSLLRLTLLLLNASSSWSRGCAPDSAFLCKVLTLLGTKAVFDSRVAAFLLLASNVQSNYFQRHGLVLPV